MSKKEVRDMKIAKCRNCLLSNSNCADCPLNWALRIIESQKIIEREAGHYLSFEIFEIPLKIIEPKMIEMRKSAVIFRRGSGEWELVFSNQYEVIEISYDIEFLRHVAWDSGIEEINITVFGNYNEEN